MASVVIGQWEWIIVLLGVFGLGVWELVKIRREVRKDRDAGSK